MERNPIPISPASEAPPEVVAAFVRFVQQNPSMFMGKQVDLGQLKPLPQHMAFPCMHCEAMVPSGLETCPQCQKPTNQTLKPLDVLVDRYQVESALRLSGGFGNLYQVKDRRTGQVYAMKQLQHRRQVTEKDRALFEREGRLLQSFQHHSLPAFQEAFTSDGAMYLVIEYLDGISCSDFLRSKGPFSEDQLLGLLPQMLEVLSYLHHRPVPVIHRDIKPGNFVILPNGRLYLVDFGAATDLSPRQDKVDSKGVLEELTGVQTKGFTAPELTLGMTPLPASDLFSLGATLLMLVSGSHPLSLYEPYSGRYHLDELPLSAGLKPILERLLALNVGDRYQDAEAVLQDLMTAGYIKPNT